MVDVRVGRASLLERLLPPLREDGTLIPERVLNPEGVSDQQRRRSSQNDMTLTQKIAITVALRELGREVKVTPRGAEVALDQPGSPADGELQVGDVIVGANGEKVTVDRRAPPGLRRRRAGRRRGADGRSATASGPSSRWDAGPRGREPARGDRRPGPGRRRLRVPGRHPDQRGRHRRPVGRARLRARHRRRARRRHRPWPDDRGHRRARTRRVGASDRRGQAEGDRGARTRARTSSSCPTATTRTPRMPSRASVSSPSRRSTKRCPRWRRTSFPPCQHRDGTLRKLRVFRYGNTYPRGPRVAIRWSALGSMAKRRQITCKDCYFRQAALCALAEGPARHSGPPRPARLEPPDQAVWSPARRSEAHAAASSASRIGSRSESVAAHPGTRGSSSAARARWASASSRCPASASQQARL